MTRPGDVDVEQTVLQHSALNLHAVGQHEGADEAARGDAAMQVVAVFLAARAAFAGHGQLFALKLDFELVGGKPRHRQGYAHAAVVPALDVVGRVGVSGGLGGALDQSAGMFEAQQEGAVEKDGSVHGRSPQASDFASQPGP